MSVLKIVSSVLPIEAWFNFNGCTILHHAEDIAWQTLGQNRNTFSPRGHLLNISTMLHHDQSQNSRNEQLTKDANRPSSSIHHCGDRSASTTGQRVTPRVMHGIGAIEVEQNQHWQTHRLQTARSGSHHHMTIT